MTARVITKTQPGNKSLAHARLQKQAISGLSLTEQTQFLRFCGHHATFRAAKGHFRGSKVGSLLAQANPITCHSGTNRLSDRFLLSAESFTPHYQLLSDPTQIQQLLSCRENPQRRLWCEMNDALFIFCSSRLVNMPARCFISLGQGSLKVRRSLSTTRRRACGEEVEARWAALSSAS